jgi:hypothetical protein
MMITDVELLACLMDLPRLETLAIADVPSVDGSTDHIVVTDALLGELTRTAGTAHLIPHLHVFRFTSLFRFNQQALLDVVTSRVESGRTAAGPFGLEVQWYPELPPALYPALIGRLDVLLRRGDMSYSLDVSEAAFAEKWSLDV